MNGILKTANGDSNSDKSCMDFLKAFALSKNIVQQLLPSKCCNYF
jgi:hypothetical protein